MSGYFDSQWGVWPAFGDPDAPGQRKPQTISGTGTTEAVNAVPLSKDRTHVLVADVDVFVSFRIDKDYGGDAVNSTSQVLIPASTVYPFKAVDGGRYGSLFVHVEAADGAGAFTVTIHQRD